MSPFDGPAPRIFTMPPGAHFVAALAHTLGRELEAAGPFSLSDALILTPTRRAARELNDAFADVASSTATLLPAIRPLGDVEEEEDPFEPGEVAFALPPAVSPARRRFELASLLMARDAVQKGSVDPAGALSLADQLATLLDEAATEGGADIAAIQKLYEDLPVHLQDAAAFLDIIARYWPARQREMERIEPAERRDRLLRVLAGRWEQKPPTGPVIAAGSTGAIPATAALLKVVARLPQGCVVLPGLDTELDQKGWDAIDEAHPQSGLKRLLEELGVERRDVRMWPGAFKGAGEPVAAQSRRRVINEALRPAAATADWLERVAVLREGADSDPFADGLDGLSLLEASDEAGEADAIALAIRGELETPDSTVLLVTPDRGLARRVSAGLARWGLDMDASMGAPLPETPAGAFLLLVLEVARDPSDPVALAALAKHARAGFGHDHNTVRTLFGELERRALRGVRAGDGFVELAERMRRRAGDDPVGGEVVALVETMSEALAPLMALARGEPVPVARFAEAHAQAAEACATTSEESGAARVWVNADGETAASLMRELLEEADALGGITLDSYARVFERLARARAVREMGEEHARVRALTPIEARLVSADFTILAGLNEGVWPATPPQDAFLSRGMREAAGLAPLERRVGLSAHDFAQLACAPRVLITRSKRVEGSPAVASRWLWRLKTLAAGAGVDDRLACETDWEALARSLDAPRDARTRPVEPPAPTPPVSARPRRFSASRISEWRRDPYGLYARMVLKLRQLEPLDKPPGPLERGNAVHEALHDLVASARDDLPADFAERLAKSAMAKLKGYGLSAAELAREEARMLRAAQWFADWEQKRRDAGWRPVALEAKGEWRPPGVGEPISLWAFADRVDQGPNGWAVLDYKTGHAPTVKEVAAGLEPQLPVEALIVANGGFGGIDAGSTIAQLAYVRVRGGRVPGQENDLSSGRDGKAPGDLMESAQTGLARWVAMFDRQETPYRSQIAPRSLRFAGDYDRLARRKEWASPGGEEA